LGTGIDKEKDGEAEEGDVEEDVEDEEQEEHSDLLACRFGGSFWEMKRHPVCPFSIARVRVDDEALGSVLYSGGELVG
jgi:hypothetical protein